jgi:hypothetical protein
LKGGFGGTTRNQTIQIWKLILVNARTVMAMAATKMVSLSRNQVAAAYGAGGYMTNILAEATAPFKAWLLHIAATGNRYLTDNEYPPISGAPTMGDIRRLVLLGDTKSVPPFGEMPCRHEWYQGRCVHCERTPSDARGNP